MMLLALAAVLAHGAQACTTGGECGHGTCQGYDPGDPGGTPPVDPTQGRCDCSGGWSGASCNVDPCTGYSCGHGTCHGNKQCSCNSGWSGPRCAHAIGCDSNPCYHGVCTATGGSHSCDCPGTGYTGDQSCSTPVSCGAAPSPPHTTGCSGSKIYQESCTATCDSGWTGGDKHSMFTCGADGQYSGSSLTCEEISCGQAPSPPHSSGCSGSKIYQESCTATCDSGWTAATPLSADFGCKADKSYIGSLTCEKVRCGTSPSPPNSHGCGAPFKFGGECTASCDSGWTGATKDATISCAADARKTTGKYSGSLNCEKVSCGAVLSPPHSTGCVSTELQYGGTCEATCDAGYTAGKPPHAKFTCNAHQRDASGVYSGNLTCKAVPCPDVPVPDHVLPVPQQTCTNMHYDAAGTTNKCTIQCAEGWTAGTKSEEFTCNVNGKIDGSLACSIVQCGPLPTLTGLRTFDQSCAARSFDFQGHCKATCDVGYTGADFSSVCEANGREASGEYNAEATACTACPAGKYKDKTGASACVDCGKGRYNENQHSTTQTACITCPIGRFSNQEVKTEICPECSAGQYQDHKKKTSCIRCQADSNTKEAEGSTKNDDCVCEKGWMASLGATKCTACASGQYKDTQGERGTPCITCEANSDTSWPANQGHTGRDHCVCKAGFGNRPWAAGQPCQGPKHLQTFVACTLS